MGCAGVIEILSTMNIVKVLKSEKFVFKKVIEMKKYSKDSIDMSKQHNSDSRIKISMNSENKVFILIITLKFDTQFNYPSHRLLTENFFRERSTTVTITVFLIIT